MVGLMSWAVNLKGILRRITLSLFTEESNVRPTLP